MAWKKHPIVGTAKEYKKTHTFDVVGRGVNMEPPLVIGSFHHVNHEKE